MSSDDKPHIPKIDETRPVVWTPEDASRFLTSAIHEAQKPLAEALKQRPITSKALTLIVAVLIIAAIVIALILSSQLEKTEKRADAIQAAREEILSEKVVLEAQTTTLQERLSAVTDQHLDLRNQIDALRQNEEKHKRTQSDLGRFRRQNELLRSQITGLEMEKVALARQLEAVRALAEEDSAADAEPGIEEADIAGDGDPFESSGAAVVDGSSPAPEEVGGSVPEPAAATEEPKETVDEPAAAPAPEPIPEPAPAPAEPVAEPEPVVPAEPEESAEPAPAPVESAAVTEEPAAPEEPEESVAAPAPVDPAPAEEVAAPEPVVVEEPGESANEPAPAPAPAEDAIDVESLRERAAEAMEKAAAVQAETDATVASAAPDSHEQFKLDPEKQAQRADAVVTAEMDKALREGRAVPGTLAEGAEDAGDRESFPEGEEDVAAAPETTEPAAETAEEKAAEEPAASEYVTLDPDAKVPAVQADEEKGE